MKNINHYLGGSLAATLLLAASPHAPAQSVVTEQQQVVTETAATGQTQATVTRGSITQYTPASKTVVVTTKTDPNPVSYSVTEKTIVVDQTGRPMMIDAIQAGVPAEVHYTTMGDQIVASRIVVQTTATTAAPAPAPVPVPAVPVPAVEREKTTTTTTRQMTEEEQEAAAEAAEIEAERREELREAAEQ
ncbi:hypothetical protein FEM03_00745 [Phragmitibacter flavus]|uniref:DUF5666 domain-containing protein n=1 Tax=Phragmitibacter flavus TaxID=2576071 RepID=A0A5R8KK58_9BACT|nr:hypothetical protein [Phragmitibacter flavus]TLD72637.1 hypothetical protein FEM03_00745 [Phragmitibacter flavus]